jgi:hypothetical protein
MAKVRKFGQVVVIKWIVDIAADFKSWIVGRNRGGLVIPPLPGQSLVKSVRPWRSGMSWYCGAHGFGCLEGNRNAVAIS